jgi:hypothetical protein
MRSTGFRHCAASRSIERVRGLTAVLLVAGCASAGSPDQPVDANGQTGDGQTQLDASMPDAPPGPQMRTLSQTTSNALKAGNSIACATNATPQTNRDNKFTRVFDLTAMGVTTEFKVTQVSFQVEHCDQISGTNGCTVAVRVGTYAGTPGATLDPNMISILASNASVAVPEIIENPGPPPTTPGGTVNAPINATIPAGSKLVVQIDAPDGQNTYSFYPGTNDGGESAVGYISSTACSITNPTNISSVGTAAAPRHLLLTVTGTYQP